MSDLVETAKEKGIATIFYNVETEWVRDNYVDVVNSDYNLGLIAGQMAAENLPENAKVVFINGRAGKLLTTQRRQGFEDGLLAQRSDVELLAEDYGEFDKALAMSLMDD